MHFCPNHQQGPDLYSCWYHTTAQAAVIIDDNDILLLQLCQAIEFAKIFNTIRSSHNGFIDKTTIAMDWQEAVDVEAVLQNLSAHCDLRTIQFLKSRLANPKAEFIKLDEKPQIQQLTEYLGDVGSKQNTLAGHLNELLEEKERLQQELRDIKEERGDILKTLNEAIEEKHFLKAYAEKTTEKADKLQELVGITAKVLEKRKEEAEANNICIKKLENVRDSQEDLIKELEETKEKQQSMMTELRLYNKSLNAKLKIKRKQFKQLVKIDSGIGSSRGRLRKLRTQLSEHWATEAEVMLADEGAAQAMTLYNIVAEECRTNAMLKEQTKFFHQKEIDGLKQKHTHEVEFLRGKLQRQDERHATDLKASAENLKQIFARKFSEQEDRHQVELECLRQNLLHRENFKSEKPRNWNIVNVARQLGRVASTPRFRSQRKHADEGEELKERLLLEEEGDVEAVDGFMKSGRL